MTNDKMLRQLLYYAAECRSCFDANGFKRVEQQLKDFIERREQIAWDQAKKNLYLCVTETVSLKNASTVQTSRPQTCRDWQKTRKL